jgi:ATP-dependent Clp protease protease subunit
MTVDIFRVIAYYNNMPLTPIVIEQTSKGERSYDIFSRLLRDRIIMLEGPIGENTASVLCAQLLFLESQEASKDITLYINSPGGLVTAGMAIYDTMQYVRSDIQTIVVGQACSMGSLLASAGTKGKRLMLPHARHMIHQPLGGASGQATDVEIRANELLRWKKELTEIYQQTTGRDLETLKADMERDKFMTPEEAVAYGLADRIIKSRAEDDQNN